VVDSCTFELEQFKVFKLLFLGQLQAMWPWVWHQKHHPLALYLAHSPSVSLHKGTDILTESMSIGMCWLFEACWDTH
jgi:hypothetical protein